MYILGLLAFLQMNYFPGLVISKLLKLRMNFIEQVVFIFGLSLSFNYVFVFLFTSFGIFNTLSLYLLILAEFIFLIFTLHYKSNIEPINFSISKVDKLLSIPIIFLALITLFTHIQLIEYSLKRYQIFNTWDAVVSWNRWAVDWGNNKLPYMTNQYPQLIPTNWAIGYKLMNNNKIQFWNKANMMFFPLGIYLIFICVAIKKKNSIYLLGIPLFQILLTYLYPFEIAIDGSVDIAFAFFGFLTIYSQFFLKKNFLLTLIFAAATAATKQHGLLLLLIIIISNFKFYFKDKKNIFKLIIIIMPSIAWYLLTQYKISKGMEYSNLKSLYELENTGVLSRSINAIKMILGKTSIQQYTVVFTFLIALLGIFKLNSRKIFLCFTIPYALIWIFGFSYDIRNFSIVIPLLTLNATEGIRYLFDKVNIFLIKYLLAVIFTSLLAILLYISYTNSVFKFFSEITIFSIFLSYLFFILMFVIGWFLIKLRLNNFIVTSIFLVILLGRNYISDLDLIQNQIEQTRNLGDSKLNNVMYDYLIRYGIHGKIVTGYQYLCFIEDLKNYCQIFPGKLELEYVHKIGAKYILNPDVWISDESKKEIDYKLKTGQFKLIFNVDGFRFIQVTQ